MSVTIKDVAERAGVSIATVSYVLTGTKKGKRFHDEIRSTKRFRN